MHFIMELCIQVEDEYCLLNGLRCSLHQMNVIEGSELPALSNCGRALKIQA